MRFFENKALTYCCKDIIINFVVRGSGGMADAHGSGPCVGNNMRVQVPSSARKDQLERADPFLFNRKFLRLSY